jgi:UDP-sulfoquinovose synthase
VKVLCIGADGYIGFPLLMRLAVKGHKVMGIDNFMKREMVMEDGSQSITPILPMDKRLMAAKQIHGVDIGFQYGDITKPFILDTILKRFKPDTIFHLGEIASAPWSMASNEQANRTLQNNLTGTMNLMWSVKKHCPDAHIIKISSMGIYEQPNIDIPEGLMEITYKGRKDMMRFPYRGGSFYHQTKAMDTMMLGYACDIWGLRATDIMQGVVYGTRTPEMVDDSLLTSFFADSTHGTAVNRFCSQAVIGYPLTVYGKGKQKRGFLALRDSIQCLNIAMDNPPEKGEYRVFNQYDEPYFIDELAQKVKKASKKLGIDATINHLENPRAEKPEHYYNPESKKLRALGFKPTMTIEKELDVMLKDLIAYKKRIEDVRAKIAPKTSWK